MLRQGKRAEEARMISLTKNLCKKLSAKNKIKSEIVHLHRATAEEEVLAVLEEIGRLKDVDK